MSQLIFSNPPHIYLMYGSTTAFASVPSLLIAWGLALLSSLLHIDICLAINQLLYLHLQDYSKIRSSTTVLMAHMDLHARRRSRHDDRTTAHRARPVRPQPQVDAPFVEQVRAHG